MDGVGWETVDGDLERGGSGEIGGKAEVDLVEAGVLVLGAGVEDFDGFVVDGGGDCFEGAEAGGVEGDDAGGGGGLGPIDEDAGGGF